MFSDRKLGGVTWAGAVRLKARVGTSNQRQLAKAINVSPSALNNYLSGRRSPDPDTLARICRVLAISADWLLGLSKAATAPRARSAPEELSAEADLLRQRILRKLNLAEVALAAARKAASDIKLKEVSQ